MKLIPDKQVTAHLEGLNPWWRTGELPKEATLYRPRAYLPQLLRLLGNTRLRRAVVLLGPRRVGKTILIQHLIARLVREGTCAQACAYVEMDHPLLHGQSLESLIGLIERATPKVAGGVRYLFFDEIQSHRDWEQHLKPLVDHRPDLRILVSGSAAAALKRQSAESGAGRFTDFLLPPLTFSEYLDLRAEPAQIMENTAGLGYRIGDLQALNAQFVEYVNYGGYPELALSPEVRGDPERFVRSDIVEKVLLRDLPQLYGIQNIPELNALFTQLAFNTAEELSLEGLAQNAGVGKITLQKYVEYLEAAFLIKRVFRVDQDGKRYQRDRRFKVYLTNPAMYTGLFGVRGADEPEFGHLVETAIFAQRFHEGVRLNYARFGNAEYEVDLVESGNGLRPVNAVEVKWSDAYAQHPERLKGLVRFAQHNGLPLVWATTRSVVSERSIGGSTVRQWPAAALAYHYGRCAERGRAASNEALAHAQISQARSGVNTCVEVDSCG